MKIHHLIHMEDLNEGWFQFMEANEIHPELFLRGIELEKLTKEDIYNIDKNLRRRNLELSIHAPSTDLAPGASDEKILEITRHRFRRTLDIAEILRPTIINLHAGYNKYLCEERMEKWIATSLETWEPLVQRAEKISTVLTLENHFEEEPTPIKRLIETINSQFFRHCFDIGHFHMFHIIPIKRWWEQMGKLTALIHIHDNHGEKDEHLAVGDGNFPYPTLFDSLKDFRHEITMTIETFNMEDARKSLHNLYRYMRL